MTVDNAGQADAEEICGASNAGRNMRYHEVDKGLFCGTSEFRNMASQREETVEYRISRKRGSVVMFAHGQFSKSRCSPRQ